MLSGDQEVLAQHVAAFERSGYDKSLWNLSNPEKLYLHLDLLPHIDTQGLNLQVSYSAAYQRQTAGYQNPFSKVALTNRMNIFIERETYPHRFSLAPEQTILLLSVITAGVDTRSSHDLKKVDLPEEILDFEYIREGLSEYY
jgi:uncharacterized protein